MSAYVSIHQPFAGVKIYQMRCGREFYYSAPHILQLFYGGKWKGRV